MDQKFLSYRYFLMLHLQYLLYIYNIRVLTYHRVVMFAEERAFDLCPCFFSLHERILFFHPFLPPFFYFFCFIFFPFVPFLFQLCIFLFIYFVFFSHPLLFLHKSVFSYFQKFLNVSPFLCLFKTHFSYFPRKSFFISFDHVFFNCINQRISLLLSAFKYFSLKQNAI